MVDSLNTTPVGIVGKLSSRQLLDFIRSEGKGNLLDLILVLRCPYVHAQMSEHAQYALLFYAHAYWLEWTDHVHSWVLCVHAHYHYYFKLRGAEQDSVPYMMKVILTHIPVQCGVVDPYLYGFLNGSG